MSTVSIIAVGTAINICTAADQELCGICDVYNLCGSSMDNKAAVGDAMIVVT